MICEVNQRTHDACIEIGDEIDQINWYLFSQKLQRMLPIIIIVAQQSVAIRCFGSIQCNREVLKKVKFIDKLAHLCNL